MHITQHQRISKTKIDQTAQLIRSWLFFQLIVNVVRVFFLASANRDHEVEPWNHRLFKDITKQQSFKTFVVLWNISIDNGIWII